jgi:Cd2+/Zn2+-exporting ATPase
LHDLATNAEAQGQTTMLLRDEEKVLGYIAFKDAIREESKTAVAAMKALGATTIMLTGDHQRVADSVGADVGVDIVKAGLLPEDKVEAVKALLGQHGQVAMVGDGVNDAPALATATVGIAMGDVGSAQAMETADLVLVGDDLRQLPFAIRLARFARHIIRQNVMLSLGVKALFMVLAVMGAATLWMAILADVGMSLLVTLNGMRPLRFE